MTKISRPAPVTREDPMQRTTRRVLAALAAAGAVAAGVTGCGRPGVDTSRLAGTVRAELAREGVHADDLACPGALPAEVGRTVRCSFTVGGQAVDIVATVTGVTGDAVGYELRTEPHPVARTVLERSVADELARVGVPAGTADCAGELAARVGATVRCVLHGGESGDTDWTVRATAVEGGKIDYSIEQAGQP